MNKKKIIGLAGAVVVCILVFVFIVIRGKSPNPAENPEEMLGRIENALGDEYKKQSMTELVATLKYGDEEGNEINYYILKTTYYEADPAEITGLNTEAIKRIVNPDRADSCQKMKIELNELPPFAMCVPLIRSDYYGGSVAILDIQGLRP